MADTNPEDTVGLGETGYGDEVGSSGSGSAPVPIPLEFHWSLILLIAGFWLIFLGIWLGSCLKNKNWFKWDEPFQKGFMTHGLGGGHRLLFALRLIFFVYSFAVHMNAAGDWSMQYYTNWNYTLLVIVLFLLLLHSAVHMMAKKLPGWITKFTWAIWHIEMTNIILVDVVYWLLLSGDGPANFTNVNVHAINIPLMLTEFLLSNITMSPAHSIFVGLFVLFYASCIWMNEEANLPYFDGDLPYFFMDPNPEPGYMAFVWYFGLFVAHFVVFFLVFGLSKLKENCWLKKGDKAAANGGGVSTLQV